MVGIRTMLKNEDISSIFLHFQNPGIQHDKADKKHRAVFPPQSTLSKRPKRRVESYRIYKRSYSACSQSPGLPLRVTEKATHVKVVGPTLSTPREDKYYNQYRPLCEVCPRDLGKVIGTLQRGGGVCGQNICYQVAAFLIPFNLICNMTMFCKS